MQTPKAVFVALALGFGAGADAQPLVLSSPSGNTSVTVDATAGRTVYSVTFGGHAVIRPSALGLGLEGAARLDSDFQVVRSSRGETREYWKPPFGERNEFPDRCNSLTVELRERIAPGRMLVVEFRAYDEGVAFRYQVPAQAGLTSFVIGDEATEFRLPKGAVGWESPRAQTPYQRVAIEEMTRASERPFLVELPGGLWAAIAEAAVESSSAMFVANLAAERHSLGARLMGPVEAQTPYTSPWRLVLLGEKPGDLLEHNYLLQNLSPASRVTSTEWIRPGKVLREVTLSTRGGREAVDFAVRHGLQYIEYDAGWYGPEGEDVSDARRVSIDPKRLRPEPEYQGLDLPTVIAYARSKGIGVWLYLNRRAIERQLDEVLPLFRTWGVAGVKYGFVNVHTQAWTRWLYAAVAKAAHHRLMVDIHDEFRPTGMSRTYPNLLTQEGIRGNEEFPDATQGTILPFTRMLAGAGDHTFCWLDPRLKNTWAYQLAHAVVIYSPLQFLYWYDRPAAFTGESAGMEWFARLPTVWDDTKVLAGYPGEFVAIARRKGEQWFVGVITNNEGREVRLPLEMLAPGRRYVADLYVDGEGLRDIRKEQRRVGRGDLLEVTLQPRGGAALVLTPEGGR
jgi:alpha-glucosidase